MYRRKRAFIILKEPGPRAYYQLQKKIFNIETVIGISNNNKK